MKKLLSANFHRLWKSKIFWILECFSAIAGAIFYILAIVNEKNIGDGWYLANGNPYFYITLVYVGVIIAVFSGFYIGTDYSDGALRNKLSVGSTRCSIYLSNLIIVIAAGGIFTATHIAVSVLVGLPFLGGLLWEALSPLGWRLLTGVILLLCYGAVFTFFAMLDSNKSRNLVVSFTLALAIIFGGILTSSRLAEPEFTSRMVMQADGSFQREHGLPNRRYIGGTTRTVYTIVDACIQSSQAFNIMRSEGEFSPLAVISMLGITAAFTTLGIAGFKKKDLK